MSRRIKRLHYLMDHDGKQAEWVVVAFEAAEPRMMEVVRSGQDPHTMTAAFMWGIDPAVIVAEHKALGKLTSAEAIAAGRAELARTYPELGSAELPRNSTLRQGGKKDNHAGNYGEGPFRYAEINGVSIRDAKLRIFRYNYVVYPGLGAWREDIQFRLRTDHFLINPLGRKLPIMGPVHGKSAEDTFKQGYAAIPQSVVHDVVMTAQPGIVAMEPEVRLMCDNHDSNTTQHWIDPREGAEACAAKILAEATAVASLMTVPLRSKGGDYVIEIETKAGLNWGEAGKENVWGLSDLARTMDGETGALAMAKRLINYAHILEEAA